MWAQIYGDKKEVLKTEYKIRQAIWKQLCLTVSIGVGDNLPYAKLGSDIAANDSICEMWTEDRESIVYPLPVSDLLYVGPATTKKFNKFHIFTIGDLAKTDPSIVCEILKNRTGASLWAMAAGLDRTPVAHIESVEDVKSVGNSNTMPRDLQNNEDVSAAFYMLGESVARRMRENGFEATTVKISVRDNDLYSFERQAKLDRPTNLTAELVPAAMELFRKHYQWYKPIRSIGIRGADLVPESAVYQLTLFDDEIKRKKNILLERCVDRIRGRFGYYSIQRAVLLNETFRTANSNNDIGDAQIFYQYG
jgi:DNA polymerase-4